MVRSLLALAATFTVLALPSSAVGELHQNGPDDTSYWYAYVRFTK